MAEPSSSLLWTIVLLVSAAPIATTYANAYIAAPREVITFIDAVEGTIEENENYDCDLAKVPRLEDKVRLSRLLREIQKQGDDLREDLNQLVIEEGGTTLRVTARIFWAGHRKQLEERVRRLDMLRMRFLVVFMGVVTTTASEQATKIAARTAPRHPVKAIPPPPPPPPPPPAPAPTPTTPRTPVGRLQTQAMGHSEKTAHTHRSGWFGVVQELQRSPILRQRHASIEAAMQSPEPMSPIGSPLSATRPVKGTTIPENFEL